MPVISLDAFIVFQAIIANKKLDNVSFVMRQLKIVMTAHILKLMKDYSLSVIIVRIFMEYIKILVVSVILLALSVIKIILVSPVSIHTHCIQIHKENAIDAINPSAKPALKQIQIYVSNV